MAILVALNCAQIPDLSCTKLSRAFINQRIVFPFVGLWILEGQARMCHMGALAGTLVDSQVLRFRFSCA